MDASMLEKFLWRRRLDAIERHIRRAQVNALQSWMASHSDVSIYQMYLIHDATAPVEHGNGTRDKYNAADAIDAATALKVGANAEVQLAMNSLIGCLREFLAHIKEG